MRSDARPVLLFAAPYFAPACHGGVVQIYLGLLSRLKQFRVVVVTDYQNTSLDEAGAWDAMCLQRYGFSVERIDAFEFRIPNTGTSRALKAVRACTSLVQFLVRGRRQWRSLCRRYKPAMVICGGTYSACWLMTENPPESLLVNYVHGEELTMRVGHPFLESWMRKHQWRALRRADLNVAVSRYSAGLIHTLAAAATETMTVLPNFIDHSRFRISGARDELRRNYEWHDKVVLLTVARLEKRKGIDQALRAIAMLRDRGQISEKWRYVIGGKGAELAMLRRLTEELDLTGIVSFIGFVLDEELPGLYEAADVFVQPNREINGDTEGFGVVFLEANACGLAVIGGKAGGTGDAIDHGRSGLRVDGESVPEIAEAIVLLMSDEELRATFRRQGIEWARLFDVEKAAVQFEALLEQTLQQGRSSRGLSRN